MKTKIFILSIISIIMFAFGIQTASAARIFLLPPSSSFSVGKTFTVEFIIDSEGQAFNAAQATIGFPKDILQVKSLGFSQADSNFNFWLQEPIYSNEQGTVSFVGGSSKGIVGSSIRILNITFVAKTAGTATVSVNGAAITASDGSGTNILSKIESSSFTISPTTTASPSAIPTYVSVFAGTTTGAVTTTIITPPTEIIRTPTPATNLPQKPVINVDLYPDQTQWYNIVSNFLVRWKLPSDITGISTAINTDPIYTPESVSEGLFDAKIIPEQKDGIYYFHIKFKNSFGWGPTTHYRIAIDTFPPLPFEISVSSGNSSDNPQPVIKFSTNDALSGLKEYEIKVGSGDFASSTVGTFTLPPQAPGKVIVLVRAVDKAGNKIESAANLDIIPIESPVITNITQDVYLGETDLVLTGTVSPNNQILSSIKDINGKEIVPGGIVKPDTSGSWVVQFDHSLAGGQYYVEVIAKDLRGALSLPVKSRIVSVQEKPIFVFAGIGVSKITFFCSLIVIILSIFAGVWFAYKRWLEQLDRKVTIAERDVMNIFDNIDHDIDEILKDHTAGSFDKDHMNQTKATLKKMKDNLEKSRRYVLDNIKEIEK